MKEIARLLKERCEGKKPSVLVTVIRDHGSAPRSAGAYMLVGENGRIAGTIGGGMLEYRATEEAVKLICAGRGGVSHYGLTKDEVAGLGMVCGGNVDVLSTFIGTDDASREAIDALLSHAEKHTIGYIALPLDGDGFCFMGAKGKFGRDVAMKSDIASVSRGVIETAEGGIYVERIGEASRVFVFGGGHLAQELVPLISHLGFRCIVTDDRAEFSSKALFPEAEELHTLEYTELAGKFDITERDFVVIVTRGHMGDYIAEKFALTTSAYYIGVVGSRRKTAEVNARLLADGFTESDIARVTTPIGLDIKSETPSEIAVSIAAQLIERRAALNGR